MQRLLQYFAVSDGFYLQFLCPKGPEEQKINNFL